jgi:hypothetical protein
MFECSWIEGSRTFNVVFGLVTGGVCLSVGVPTVRWVLPRYRAWLFSPSIDPRQGIQLAYGIFCIAMACTDVLCRTIPHGPLPWVHPAFFLTTLIIGLGLGPRVLAVALRERRRGNAGREPRAPGKSAALGAAR